MNATLRRLDKALARLGTPRAEITDEDRAAYDWYGDGCACGVELGGCDVHHRARESQRPPPGDWRQWMMLAGRASGKTRSGAEWVRHLVESGEGRRIALIAPTHRAVRDVQIEGESGILSVCPPWAMPRYNPSRLLLTWPDGATAQGYSGEEPDRLRGPQFSHCWIDELAACFDPDEVWRQINFSSRIKSAAGVKKLITTTPRPLPLIRALAEAPTTALVRFSSYENRAHLDAAFLDVLTSTYEGNRYGKQEIHGEILETGEHLVYPDFDPQKHVTSDAEYRDGLPVYVAVDCGTSLCTAAVWYQVRPWYAAQHRVTVFAECQHDHEQGSYAEAAARRIKAHGETLPSRGALHRLVVDPFGQPETGVGTAARNSYEKVFGDIVDRWPGHQVTDGVDQACLLFGQGNLLIHPRCVKLKAALLSHGWEVRRGIPTGRQSKTHPHSDFCDAMRGGIRDLFPEGVSLPPKKLTTMKWSGRP